MSNVTPQNLPPPPACATGFGAPTVDAIIAAAGVALGSLGVYMATMPEEKPGQNDAGLVFAGVGFGVTALMGSSAAWGFHHRLGCREAVAAWSAANGRPDGNRTFDEAGVDFEQKTDRFLRTETLTLRGFEFDAQDVGATFIASKSPHDEALRLVLDEDGSSCLGNGLAVLVDDVPVQYPARTFAPSSSRLVVYGVPFNVGEDYAELEGLALEDLERWGGAKKVETRVCGKEGALSARQLAALAEFARRVRAAFGPTPTP